MEPKIDRYPVASFASTIRDADPKLFEISSPYQTTASFEEKEEEALSSSVANFRLRCVEVVEFRLITVGELDGSIPVNSILVTLAKAPTA